MQLTRQQVCFYHVTLKRQLSISLRWTIYPIPPTQHHSFFWNKPPTMKEKKKTSCEIAGAKPNQPQSGVRAGFPSFDTRFGHQLYVFPTWHRLGKTIRKVTAGGGGRAGGGRNTKNSCTASNPEKEFLHTEKYSRKGNVNENKFVQLENSHA